jgi:hypothetical protein
MRARYILEKKQWEKISIAPAASMGMKADGGVQTAMQGMPGMSDNASRYSTNGAWIFIAGFGAAKLGDPKTADQAATQLHAMAEKTASSGNAYAAKPFAIMEMEVQSAAQLARGQKEDAVRLAKEAADIELAMAAPSGPPEPIKPAMELYGETLLEAGQPGQAAAAFEKSLERTPNRTPLVKDMAQTGKSSVN